MSSDPVAAARRLAAEVLAPTAEATDRASVVPRSHLDALAGARLCRLYCPPEATPVAAREVFEALAGACGVTFFVWVQHHAPVRMLARSPNVGLRERHLEDLCSGRVLGGVAFAYLRRPGQPAVVARRVPGGWRVDGEAPWVTSWGLAGLFSVAARVGDDVVYFLVGGEATAHVQPSPPLSLAAMGASATVRLRFDDLFVPDDDVVAEMSYADWQAFDRTATSQPNPAAFGIAATCVRLLADHDPDAGKVFGAEVDECRARSYALADSGNAELPALVEARAEGLALAVRTATALVTSVGGRAMALDHPAQRLLREAVFFTIQAQTPELRRATLDQLRR
ncbi:MAG TPA: acyl-CoA dehydrogenase family protein [Acidimicrobiales bacterium]|nr:acyl-CoA dehydrogenase family protein [Acidimicrobiales bacterium]